MVIERIHGDFINLEQSLGHSFQNHALLRQAVTHPSYLHENSEPGDKDYQRLEYLGDAILGMLLAELLYFRYPEWDEGALSRLRSRLAGQDVLADRARIMRLGDYIVLGKGEEQSAGRDKDSILADVLEALIAAIFLDAGLNAARSLIVRLFDELAAAPHTLAIGRDSKSELQEYLSLNGYSHPEYLLTDESGPPHERLFCFTVQADGVQIGEGAGRSKKNAQQAAAAAALEKLKSGDGRSV